MHSTITNINTYKHSKLVFLGVALTAVIINLDIAIANLALAPIGRVFHSTLTTLQWIIIAYVLFGVAFLIFSGRLADIIGRKKVYVMGVTLFIIASLVCGLAPNVTTLIIGRALQGIAFAFTLALGLLIATSVFPDTKRGTILGFYSMVAGTSQALGPIIGGIILQYASWRWLFFINVPLGLSSLYFILTFYPAKVGESRHKSIDFFGTLLLAAGLIFVILALNELNISYLISGILLLLFFVGVEKRAKNPLIDFSIFHNRPFVLIALIRNLNMFASFAIIFIIPLFLQNILGKSPLTTGIFIFSFTACYAIISPVAGKILDRFGYKKPLIFAIIIGIIAFIQLAFIRVDAALGLLLFGLALVGVNKAIMLPASVGIVISSLPQEKKGVGMGLFYSIALLGATLGVALTGLVTTFFGSRALINMLPANFNASTSQLLALKHATSGAIPITALSNYFPASQQKILVPIVQHAFLSGFSIAMWLIAIGMSCSLLLSLFLFKGCKNYDI